MVKAPDENAERFAAELAEAIDRAGMTLQDVVFGLYDHGVKASPQSVSSWATGRYTPRERATVVALDAVVGADGALLAALGVTADTLMDRVERLETMMSAIVADLEDLKLSGLERGGQGR